MEKLNSTSGGGPEEVIIGTTYLPYDSLEKPPSRGIKDLVGDCRKEGSQLIIGGEDKVHH